MNWLSFIHPWMLAALGAVALPVLIHFLTRARPRRIAFPPYQFLVEACAGQQSLHRLRTIVLLTTRALAVLALVLLFAQPFLKPPASTAAAASSQRIAIILDASASMRAVDQGVTLFARAQAEAADVLRTLDPAAQAVVILEGLRPRALLPALSRNIPALHEALVKAEPTFESGDPAAALSLASRLLGGPGVVFVFSDFQKSNWDAVRELPPGLACHLRPVTDRSLDNVGITAANLSPAEPVLGESIEVRATVFNATSRPRQENVRLDLADTSHESSVTVPAFGSADALFNISVPRPGSFPGKLSLPPDDLAADNSRFFVARVNDSLKILLVSDADESDQQSAAFYLARALAPSPEAAPGLTVIRRQSQDADRGVLETADLFVLAPPATLSGEATDIIARRLKDGARLLVFLDGPTAPPLLSPSFDPPFRLLRSVVSEPGDTVSSASTAPLLDGDLDDLWALRFHRHFQCEIVESRKNEILLKYADGAPALALTRQGGGAAAFVNLPLTPDGGDFIGHPLFPAMLHELLRHVRRSSAEQPVTPGVAWTLDVPAKGDQPFTVTDPRGVNVPVQVISSGRLTRLALPPAQSPGDYSIKQGETVLAHAVVNLDPRETDIRPIAAASLKPAPGAAAVVAQSEDDLLLAGKSRQLWPLLAAAAAAFLALEMLLLSVWRAPRRSSADRTLSDAADAAAPRPSSAPVEVLR